MCKYRLLQQVTIIFISATINDVLHFCSSLLKQKFRLPQILKGQNRFWASISHLNHIGTSWQIDRTYCFIDSIPERARCARCSDCSSRTA